MNKVVLLAGLAASTLAVSGLLRAAGNN